MGIIIIVGVACKKEKIEQLPHPIQSVQVNPNKVFKLPNTPQEQQLVANLELTTNILKELYKKPKHVRLVNAAIASQAYTDESVLLADLVYPGKGSLQHSALFAKLVAEQRLHPQDFAQDFWQLANTLGAGYARFLEAELGYMTNLLAAHSQVAAMSPGSPGGNGGAGVSIYFPYASNFPPAPGTEEETYGPLVSLQTATADADEGIGLLPVYNSNGEWLRYEQVLVNDDYCYANPTHIIGVNGIEPYSGPIEPNTPPPPPLPPPGVNRVYVGQVICKNQYDKLISFTGNGGGSEIRVCRISGYLQPVNGQITTFGDEVQVPFTRKQISDRVIKRTVAIWDADWQAANAEQIFAIWEEDNVNTKTFNGQLSTSLLGGTGTIGFNVVVQSQDAIIRQLKISRSSYFANAFNDQGWGFSDDYSFLPLPYSHGWPWYDGNRYGGASVVWTWPYKVTP